MGETVHLQEKFDDQSFLQAFTLKFPLSWTCLCLIFCLQSKFFELLPSDLSTCPLCYDTAGKGTCVWEKAMLMLVGNCVRLLYPEAVMTPSSLRLKESSQKIISELSLD